MKAVEYACWLAAAACLLPFVGTTLARDHLAGAYSNGQVQPAPTGSVIVAGEPANIASAQPVAVTPGPLAFVSPDMATWSAARRAALTRLRDSAPGLFPRALGTIDFPAQQTTFTVFAGEGEAAMTLGVGHLADTTPPDGDGNIALTAHRDGPFRLLKDVSLGDRIILNANGRERAFTVTEQKIVGPEQLEVLQPTTKPVLTLITCYPFYFVGSAPQRFIVRAALEPRTPTEGPHRALGAINHPPHQGDQT